MMIKPRFIRRTLLPEPMNYIHLISLIALLMLSAQWSRAASQQTDGVTALASGVAVAGQVSGGQVHHFQFAMDTSQMVKLAIDVQGTDLTLSLLGVDGQKLDEKKITHKSVRTDIMLWEAQMAGVYRLQIAADEKAPAPGKYVLRMDLTPASDLQSQAFRKQREADKLRQIYLADPKIEPLNQAIQGFKEALELWRRVGNRELEARALFYVGRMIYDIDEDASAPEKTIAYYLEALPIFHDLGLKDFEAITLNNLAGAYSFLGDLSKSLEYHIQSAALSDYGPPATAALKQISISNLYNKLGEYQLALEHGLKALAIDRQLGDQYQQMADLMIVGETYRLMGEPIKALAFANQGLALTSQFKKIGRSVYLYVLVGKIYGEAGDHQKALTYFTQALEISRGQKALSDIAVALENIGDLYREAGDTTKALAYYQEAAPLYKAHGRKSGEAQIAIKVGSLLSENGEVEKAVAYQTRAYEFFHASQSRRFEIGALYEIAKTQRLKGDLQKARELFNQALSLTNALDNQQMAAQIYKELSAIARAEGDRSTAIELMTRALNKIEDLRSRFIIQDLKTIFSAKAEDFYADYIDLVMNRQEPSAGDHQVGLALQAAERAKARGLLDLLSESPTALRHSVDPRLLEKRQTFQQKLLAKETAHERLSSNPATRKQAEAILKERNELSIQLQLLEAEIRKSSPHYATFTETQLLSATEIQQLLGENTVLLEFALGKKQSWLWAVTPTSINSYPLPSSQEIEPMARQVYELLTARQPRKGETAAQSQVRVTEAEARFLAQSAQLSHTLLGPIAHQLQSAWKGKRLVIVAAGALEYIPFAALPVPVASGRWSVAGEAEVRGQGSGVSKEESKSNKVTRQDISKDRPPTTDHRPLPPGHRPPTSDHRPPTTGYRALLVEHEVVNIPSASVLAAIRKESLGRKPADKLIAVIADPVFDPTDPRVLNVSKNPAKPPLLSKVRSGDAPFSPGESPTTADTALGRSLRSFSRLNERGGFSRLPFSREEAEAIARLAGSSQLLKATDFQASRTTATQGDLARFRILHFATHGLLNSERPELSGLVLSLVDEHGKPQDGFLRMHEIYNLHLPADLVVLSACQTALGKQIKGEGLVGLTRGFMYAGAERVVASLWQVDDLATAELMKSFYRRMLKEGRRPSEALRLAQLEMYKQKRWSSPYFWAAFIIQGEWK